MKVLIFGASGYIGHEVVLAFVHAGHDVFGATRTLHDYKKLEAEEITPFICDFLYPSEYRDIIQRMDVVIDVAGGADVAEIGPTILQTTIEESAKARPNGPPLSYIYCSGSWVHGDAQSELLSDLSPIASPAALSAWRAPLEQKIVSSISRSFTANIIRPGMVYGGSSSMIGYMLFASARQGQVTWYGDENTRMPTTHNHDLAKSFVLCAEKSYSVPGIVFDICNPSSELIPSVLARLKNVSKAEDIVLKEPETDLESALACSADIRPQLARSLLGWEPRKQTLVDGMERYYMAWLGSLPQ